MGERHYLVVGNGPAGNQAVHTLREVAPDDRVTLVSRARVSSYSPRLLPDFIAGKIREEEIFLCPFEAYAEKGIKVRSCQEAVAVDVEKQLLTLDHKEVVPYDGLIIAVGGVPHLPAGLEPFHDLIFTLKTLEDARVWIDTLREADRILLIGGDLTSFAVTRALLHLGKKVSFILNDDAFWPLRPEAERFDRVAALLGDRGVNVLPHRSIKSVARLPDGSLEARLDEGRVAADMIGAFFGLLPDVDFLKKSGMRIDRGILVDEYLCTGCGGVYAAGDCAQIYHPALRDYWVSVGHDNARLLGRIAALNLASGEGKEKAQPESMFTLRGIRVNTSWWEDY